MKKNRAFSLFEILIAITVMAMLIFVSYLFVPKLIAKAYDAKRKTDLYKIKSALEQYYSLAEGYPDTLPDCGQPLIYKTQVILSSTPCDPNTKENYPYQSKKITTQYYRLYAKLSDSTDPSISNLGCQGGCGPNCAYNYGVSSMNTILVKCSYVCAPGGGKSGSCELYSDPIISLCPKLYARDSLCNHECNLAKNRCQNASGKNIPY